MGDRRERETHFDRLEKLECRSLEEVQPILEFIEKRKHQIERAFSGKDADATAKEVADFYKYVGNEMVWRSVPSGLQRLWRCATEPHAHGLGKINIVSS